MNHTFCQSCGMPIDAPALRGTERGGTPSEHYCKYCYQEGAFTGEMTMEEMIDFCTPMMVRANPELTPSRPGRRWPSSSPVCSGGATNGLERHLSRAGGAHSGAALRLCIPSAVGTIEPLDL
ncbi:zinc ribbon domain-containing protein [Flavonifractor plautii]|nr:zinc ribbon domain-containing protein [Flavonifractor plautii]